MPEFKPRPVSELVAAGDPRWEARVDKNGLVFVKDMASGEEVQAVAYTVEPDAIRFSLPGDNGLRTLRATEPGYDAFAKALEKSPISAPAAKAPEKAAEKPAEKQAEKPAAAAAPAPAPAPAA
jgi:hypothetical protein